MSGNEGGPRKRRKLSPPDPGPYVLRNVLDDIPLKAEEDQEEVSITCVEYWSRYCFPAGEGSCTNDLEIAIYTLELPRPKSYILLPYHRSETRRSLALPLYSLPAYSPAVTISEKIR